MTVVFTQEYVGSGMCFGLGDEVQLPIYLAQRFIGDGYARSVTTDNAAEERNIEIDKSARTAQTTDHKQSRRREKR